MDALVLEAVYPTIGEPVADRFRIRLGALGPPLASSLTIQLPLWASVSASDPRPIEAIRRLNAPVLIIAGERDQRTPLDESRRLSPQPKTLWIVTGAGHDDFHETHRRDYEARVGAFLKQYLDARH